MDDISLQILKDKFQRSREFGEPDFTLLAKINAEEDRRVSNKEPEYCEVGCESCGS